MAVRCSGLAVSGNELCIHGEHLWDTGSRDDPAGSNDMRLRLQTLKE